MEAKPFLENYINPSKDGAVMRESPFIKPHNLNKYPLFENQAFTTRNLGHTL
jgi:hypothetical protein